LEDILTQLPGLLPILIVVGILGITWGVNRATMLPPSPEYPTGKANHHLVLLPLVLGLVSGAVHYFVAVDIATFHDLPGWRHAVTAMEMGFGYGGAGVLLWELFRRYLRKPKSEASP
jgi:hypothetical protein